MHRRIRSCSLAVLLLAALAPGCGTESTEIAGPGQLVSKAYLEALATVEAKSAEILPAPAERRWEEIDWQATYADGLKASAEQGKPLMLWVMNGHPLGCT